jgi:glycosyltransferase involved in cell wall biosynthesis
MPDLLPPTYQHLLRRADAVTCCSQFIRTRFLSAADYPAERTFVVHNGADLSAYSSTEGRSLRAQWGFNHDDFVVLYTGAIVPEKGVASLVRAFAKLQSSVPNATLIIVGSSQLWAMPGGNSAGDGYEAQVRRLADGLRVRFVGSLPRSQMPAAFMAADVVAVPSIWDDPHPTVVCEAMAAGRPVIASQAGGITETVNHQQTGILVSPGDEEQLSEAIRTMAYNRQICRQMGDAARERAKAFTWEASAQRLGSIYQELLQARGGDNERDRAGRGKQWGR